MSNIIARKPNNVLFGVGEHTTCLQNRIIATALSCFRIDISKTELEALSDDELWDKATTMSKQRYDLPIQLFAQGYDITQTNFQLDLYKRVQALVAVGYGYVNETQFVRRSIFQEVSYAKGKDIVQFLFTPVFVQDLLRMLLCGYTPIKLEAYLRLTQEYAGKFYLQVISELTFKSDVSLEYTIDELKKLLGVVDHNNKYIKKAYSRWDNFQHKVLEGAIEDINAVSDLEISYETRKKGKSIHFVKLNIKRRGEIPVRPISESKPIDQLRELGINLNTAREIALKYPQKDFISFACRRSRQRAETNPAGYLVTSIEDMFELWEMQNEKQQMAKQMEERTKKAEKEKDALKRELEKQRQKEKQEAERTKKAELEKGMQDTLAQQTEYDSQPENIKAFVRSHKKKLEKMEDGKMFLPEYLLFKELVNSGAILDGHTQETFL